MFTLQEKLQFVHVDIEYVKALYEACSEVYYMPDEYENKPCIGILLSDGGHKYVLPLTSAKDVWVGVDDTDIVKHIMSALDIKKMIPVVDNVISVVDINYSDDDSEDDKKYKDLLNKEYSFCVKIVDDVILKASKLYEKQVKTGKVQMFACDFLCLEKVADSYEKKNNKDQN